MNNRTDVHGSLALAATDATPRIHTDHRNGTFSLALTHENDWISVYVRGTRDELLELAARIAATVPAAECNPLAGMHVAPHTCGLRAREDDEPISLGESLTELDVANEARARAARSPERAGIEATS